MKKLFGDRRNFIYLFLLLSAAVIFVAKRACMFPALREQLPPSYAYDSMYYWTTARMMHAGAAPYSGVFDYKPPLWFFTNLWGYRLSGHLFFNNYASLLMLAAIAGVPVAFLGAHMRRKSKVYKIELAKKRYLDRHLLFKLAVLTLSLLFCAYIMMFTVHRGEFVQPEIFASAYAVVFASILAFRENLTLRSPYTYIAALFAALAVLTKEPYVLILIALCGIFAKGFKGFWNNVIIMLIAAALCALFMLCTGTLLPLFQIYFPIVFGFKSDSLKYLVANLPVYKQHVSVYMMVSCCILLGNLLLFSKKNPYLLVRLLCALFLLIYTVSTGSWYFGHHFLFLVPVVIGLYLFSVRQWADGVIDPAPALPVREGPVPRIEIRLFRGRAEPQREHKLTIRLGWTAFSRTLRKWMRRIYLPLSVVFVSVFLFLSMNPHYRRREEWGFNYDNLVANAAYVDALLSCVGEDASYIALSAVNPQDGFAGCTEYPPLGPIFFSHVGEGMFPWEEHWTSVQFKQQLEQADVYFWHPYDFYASLDAYVNEYLAENFTTEPPAGVAEPPASFGEFVVYYRLK
ncbi:MAG: hypothetical protein FWF10_08185 [Clostridiales bacterium]|nr:hypothetical protein [Clostridiales bacterium]